MKNFSFLILALTFFITLSSYSNPIYKKNNFIKMRERFQKIDTNGDGLLSKDEMISAHSDRINNLKNLIRIVIINYQKKNYAH